MYSDRLFTYDRISIGLLKDWIIVIDFADFSVVNKIFCTCFFFHAQLSIP